jgi:acetyltransferase
VIDFESLSAIFRPECVAVVGACDRSKTVGHAVYSNLKTANFPGRLIPVNQQHTRIQNDRAYHSLNDVDVVPDLVVVCTPASTVPDIARTCGERGVRGMVVISAGFRETGEAGQQLELELRSVLQQYPKLRMIGPNCLGVLAPHSHLNASFSATMPHPGNLAMISQSGALCTAMLDWADERQVGFSACVSVGNMLNVGMGDLIDYFAADPKTSALLLYIESITDPRHFMAAARACTRTKPIIALKSGRFAESSQAASSHTGAIAGVDMVYEAALRRAGIERIFSFDDLLDCARLIVNTRTEAGPRLAIITNAGGPGVMASDAWLAQGGKLARLSAETIESLNCQLPPQWSHGNPIDVLGDAPPERYAAALEIVARDPGVDSVIVMLTPQSMTDATAIADALSRFKLAAGKPLLAVWMGGPAVRRGRQILEKAGIPVYSTPEQATNALTHLVSAGVLRDQRAPLFLDSHPANSTQKTPTDEIRMEGFAQKISAKWRDRLANAPGLLGEIASKELLADYSLPIVPTRLARTSDEAAEIAGQCGFPAVLKIVSPDISHKTDVGGVELSLANAAAVREGYQRIMSSVAEKQPAARIEGVSVQLMIAPTRGVELLLGATRDAAFGPVIVIGSGGVTAEIQHDVAMQLPPLTPSLALEMLQSLRIAPILQGYRGRPGVDLAKLAEVVASFSRLVEDRPELQAVEINPLLVTAGAVLALDARVIVAPTVTATLPYAHLAVRPYPFDLIQDITLECGERLRLRPIHPDDESMWLAWVKQYPEPCSQFLPFPRRACSLDYDTEMLFVAESADHNWVGSAFTQARSGTRGQQSIIEVVEETIRSDLRRRLLDASEKWYARRVSQ